MEIESSTMNLAIALRGALAMILVGAVLGLAHNALSPDPVPWKPVPKTTLSLDDLVPNDPGVAGGETGRDIAEGSPDVDHTPADERAGLNGAEHDDVEPAAGQGSEAEPAGGDETLESEESDGQVETAGEPVTKAADDMANEPEAESGSGDVEADYSDIPESQFPIEIPLAKAKDFYDRGGLLVLDARDLDEYETGHIANAESAPFNEMVADVDWLERTAAYPHPILVYCDGTDCELSLNLAFEISQNGHPRVLVLKDGYGAWADAGYPTATGDRP